MLKRSTSLLAKKLVILSLEDGFVSEKHVQAVLQALNQKPPRDYEDLLEAYLKKMRIQLRNEEILIECADQLDDASTAAIKGELSKHYNRTLRVKQEVNPDLIAGVRVRVGDDVWDASALGRLELISQFF